MRVAILTQIVYHDGCSVESVVVFAADGYFERHNNGLPRSIKGIFALGVIRYFQEERCFSIPSVNGVSA